MGFQIVIFMLKLKGCRGAFYEEIIGCISSCRVHCYCDCHHRCGIFWHTRRYHSTRAHSLLVYEPICKPFKKSHHEQLSLVSDYSWIDFASLDGIEDEIHELLLGENVEKYIDEQRRNAIITGISERIENLKKIAKTHLQKNFNSLENDVLEDIATEYSGETEL